MAAKQVKLIDLFQGVMAALSSGKDALNQQDTYNHDHGDNMVQVFDTVARAMKEKDKARPSDAGLSYLNANQTSPSDAHGLPGALMSATPRGQYFAPRSFRGGRRQRPTTGPRRDGQKEVGRATPEAA